MHPLLDLDRIDGPPGEFLASVGEVFATFGWPGQDSGNVSYGLRVGERRWFVKTAGEPDGPTSLLSHGQRVALLRNAVDLAASCGHPALAALRRVVESPRGPMLVYEWADGALLRGAIERARGLDASEVAAIVGVVLDLHVALAAAGWVAGDLYDGCLIYDFERRAVKVVDLDHYRRGPSVNAMGRMFGSTRFMAPEEFVRGAAIDERTTVFNLGRLAFVLLGDGSTNRAAFRGDDRQYAAATRACRGLPGERFATVEEFRRRMMNDE